MRIGHPSEIYAMPMDKGHSFFSGGPTYNNMIYTRGRCESIYSNLMAIR